MDAWYVKPLSGFWKARGYFAVAVIVFAGHVLIAAAGLKPSNFVFATWQQSEGVQILDKAFGSLDKIAAMVLIAGFVYAVLADLLEIFWPKVAEEVKVGFSNVSSSLVTGVNELNEEIVKKWIAIPGARKSLKNIGVTSLTQHYDPTKKNGGLTEYIIENILDRYASSESITRRNFINNITVSPHADNNFLSWHDNKTYTLVCPKGSGEVRMRGYISIAVQAEDVESVLGNINYTCKVGANFHIDVKEWLSKRKDSLNFSADFSIDEAGVKVAYRRPFLSINFDENVKLNNVETRVELTEISMVPISERCFCLIIDQPTYDLTFDMRFSGMSEVSVHKPLVGANWHYFRDAEFANVSSANDQSVSAHVPGWVLPGLAISVEWVITPRT